MFVSIIIPVYNAEKCLRKCVDSVLAQSYGEFEVLLINDGSTDSSGIICDDYVSKHLKIKTFHKENGGVSTARNLGIDKAKGEFVLFIDSDDFVSEKFVQNIIEDYQDEDLIIAGFKKISHKKTEEKTTVFPNLKFSKVEREKYLEEFPVSDNGYPFSKLYKRSLLTKHNIRFLPKIHMFEDVIFLFTYIKYCEKMAFNSSCDYYYVIAEGDSLSTKVNSFESEYLSFITFYKLISNDYNITTKQLRIDFPKLGYRLSRLMNRSISTLYLKRYDKAYCINSLKQYTNDAWDIYNFYSEPVNVVKKVSKKLLVKKKFNLADTILRVSYKLFK